MYTTRRPVTSADIHEHTTSMLRVQRQFVHRMHTHF